jgi:hypothetical protein
MAEMNRTPASSTVRPDAGSVLPLVLVLCVILSLVVVAVAKYATADLRYGRVVEDSADRLATADAAMDNALEEFSRGTSPCVLTQLADLEGGYTYSLQDTINGIQPEITCEVVGGDVNAVDAFAVVLTGENGQSGPLLDIRNGGNSNQAQKTFEGPVYMAAAPAVDSTVNLMADLKVLDGDLWYTNSTCPSGTVDLDNASKEITIAPAGYTTKCLTETWEDLFLNRKPPETPVSSLGTPDPVVIDSLGCRVWSPGRYTAAPDLHDGEQWSYNYFRSGDYYFENIGVWTLDKTWVLAGWPGTSGPSIEDNKNGNAATNPCRNAWTLDSADAGNPGDQSGATFYMGGDSQIGINNNASLEISGRLQGTVGADRFNVGLQALETIGVPSALPGAGNDRIVGIDSGSGAQLSIQGLVWAPYTGLTFEGISNDAVAALTGGAVLAELSAGASANTENFVISVETQPTEARFRITTTATNTGTTEVSTLLDYRTDKVYSIISRRVLDLTPE